MYLTMQDFNNREPVWRMGVGWCLETVLAAQLLCGIKTAPPKIKSVNLKIITISNVSVPTVLLEHITTL